MQKKGAKASARLQAMLRNGLGSERTRAGGLWTEQELGWPRTRQLDGKGCE